MYEFFSSSENDIVLRQFDPNRFIVIRKIILIDPVNYQNYYNNNFYRSANLTNKYFVNLAQYYKNCYFSPLLC